MKTFSQVVKIFFSAFLQIFAIAVQTKNYAQSQYVYAFLTSLLISSMWIINTSNIVKKCKWTKVAYMLGSACGGLAGIALHDYILS